MSNKILYIVIAVAVSLGILGVGFSVLAPTAVPDTATTTPEVVATSTDEGEEGVMCTADAMLCPDGSYVGRTGPNCQFVCAATPVVPADVQAHIDSKANKIKLQSPAPLVTIASPLTIVGEAVGPWYFEASAPVTLVDWDGKIIAQSHITASGDWMTTNFVPFMGELTFTSPYKAGDPDFMKRGSLILQKDNPSGLPENDDALEIPIQFAP